MSFRNWIEDNLLGLPRPRRNAEEAKQLEAIELTDNDLITWLDEAATEQERFAASHRRNAEEHDAQAKRYRQLIKKLNAVKETIEEKKE